MSLTSAAHDLGMARGLRSGQKEVKAERIADEDREHVLERRKADDEWTDQSRVAQTRRLEQQDQAAGVLAEQRAVELEKLKRGIDEEGALDFLYEIEGGIDPVQAAARHNQKGRTRIVPESVRYDASTGEVEFDSPDADGDGVPEKQRFHVANTIDVMEKVTGKNQKDRFMNVPDGGMVLDRRTREIVANNPKDQTAAARASADRPVKLGPRDRLVDPTTGKVRVAPIQTGVTTRTRTLFNEQTYTKDVTNAMGRLLGGKFDPATGQFGFEGATDKMTRLSRVAQRQAQRMLKHGGRISADMVASVIADLGQQFDEKAIREQARVDAETNISPDDAARRDAGKMFGLGKIKPSVVKQMEDEAVTEALANLEAQVIVALDSEVARLAGSNGEAALPDSGTQEQIDALPDDEEVDDEEIGDDPTATAADQQPAVAQAPPEAVEYLKKNPHLKEQFQKKYGYLPPGL
jgi:hypothetical protein